jgi:hypothetical protein
MSAAILLFCASLLRAAAAAAGDWRALDNAHLMLEDQYLDQPYVVVVPHPSAPARSRWVATITRNSQPEGHRGEHVECLFSDDAGATWSTPVKLEPGAGTVEGLTNSYSALAATDFGRIYVTYNINIDNITHTPDGKPYTRDDTQGAYVARWSDDAGETWSQERLRLPVRAGAVDRNATPFHGSLLLFWSVDQYKRRPDGDATVFLGFTKIGTFLYAPPEEAWLFSSPNLLTERNASRVTWNTLPAGDVGVQSVPAGTINEETHIIPLTNAGGGGGCYMVFRTDQGHLACAATRDGSCATGWGAARPASFWHASPAARALGAGPLNPRGPITLKRLSTGRYLLLFYNDGDPTFASRNPYWLAAGVEDAASGEVLFSQPEVFTYYAPDYFFPFAGQTRPGYPDIVEDLAAGATPACPTPDGSGCTVFVTETNKTQARVHGVPPDFLAALLGQDTISAAAARGLARAFPAGATGATFPTPPLAPFLPQGAAPFQSGWTVEFYLRNWAAGASPGQALLDARAPATGAGFAVVVVAAPPPSGGATLALLLRDDAGVQANLTLNGACASLLARADPPLHHVALLVDGAARVAIAVVDGFLCNAPTGGSAARGWAYLPMALAAVTPAPSFKWGGEFGGDVAGGRWYARALSVTEAVGNSRAGPPA